MRRRAAPVNNNRRTQRIFPAIHSHAAPMMESAPKTLSLRPKLGAELGATSRSWQRQQLVDKQTLPDLARS